MPAPEPDPGPTTFLASLGARGHRRAEPRASVAIAAAGCALAVLGVLIIAGDSGSGDGSFNRVPGLILSALVVAAGYFTLAGTGRGPVATAGTVAAALGVPPLLFFLTFDEGSLPPYSTEAILFVSTIVWLATYAVGPGRGRPFLLGAGLIGLWASLLQLTEDVFDAPFLVVGGWFGSSTDASIGFGPGGPSGPMMEDPSLPGGFGGPFMGGARGLPDPTTIGLLSLALGAGYVLASRWLDRRHHQGVATPFALAALPALFAGVVSLTDDLEQAGTGLLMVAVGAGLALHGGSTGRRATTWTGGTLSALGTAIFLADLAEDAYLIGMLYLTGGIALVLGAHAVARATHEPDELMALPPVEGAGGVSPYAPDWTPPPAAPVEPGHWNPPGTEPPPPPPPPPPSSDPAPPS